MTDAELWDAIVAWVTGGAGVKSGWLQPDLAHIIKPEKINHETEKPALDGNGT